MDRTLILFTALSWGLIHALVLSQPLPGSAATIATLSTVAFGTAMGFNFARPNAHCRSVPPADAP